MENSDEHTEYKLLKILEEAILDEHNLRGKLDEVLYIDMRFDERVYYKIRE